jgi:hypothetical protein
MTDVDRIDQPTIRALIVQKCKDQAKAAFGQYGVEQGKTFRPREVLCDVVLA